MRIVWYAHSGVRYLVFLAAFVLAGLCISGLLRGKPGPRGVRVASGVFVGLLDLQMLLGLGLVAGGFYTPRVLGHIALVVPAITVAHVFHVLGKKREGGAYRYPLIGVVSALVLVAIGLAAIGRAPFTSTVPWGNLTPPVP